MLMKMDLRLLKPNKAKNQRMTTEIETIEAIIKDMAIKAEDMMTEEIKEDTKNTIIREENMMMMMKKENIENVEIEIIETIRIITEKEEITEVEINTIIKITRKDTIKNAIDKIDKTGKKDRTVTRIKKIRSKTLFLNNLTLFRPKVEIKED
jgi:hypothetical protein